MRYLEQHKLVRRKTARNLAISIDPGQNAARCADI
jgi:hypothetical protein